MQFMEPLAQRGVAGVISDNDGGSFVGGFRFVH